MNMEKINAARAELTEQAQKEKRTELANFIEEHINSLLTTEEAAEKVKGKKLSELISKIVAKARSKAINSCGMLTSEEVAEMAEEFYELSADSQPEPKATETEKMNVLDLF